MEAKAFVSFFEHSTEVEGKTIEFTSAVFNTEENGVEQRLCAFGPFADLGKLTLVVRKSAKGEDYVCTRWPVVVSFTRTDDPEIVEIASMRELPAPTVRADASGVAVLRKVLGR